MQPFTDTGNTRENFPCKTKNSSAVRENGGTTNIKGQHKYNIFSLQN